MSAIKHCHHGAAGLQAKDVLVVSLAPGRFTLTTVARRRTKQTQDDPEVRLEIQQG
jgi:hypothetical protein